jgi:Flp pilus assembly protein TadG
MVEFAAAVPVLFFVLFAVLEGSLAMFTINSARFAVGEAARQVGESGTDPSADSSAVQLIRTGVFGATSLATVTEIDIYRATLNANGRPVQDTTNVNRYKLDGSAISTPVPWPPSARSARNGSSDFVGVTIKYQYNWISGRLLASGPVMLTQDFYVRIEPQSY